MKEILNIKNKKEDLFNKIEQKILFAKQNAPDLELIQLKSINKKNETEIIKLLEKGTISVETLFEFSLAMKLLGISDKERQDYLSHENAHANKAESLGVQHLGYKIPLVKIGNELFFKPYTHINMPNEWSDEKTKKTLRKILLAPNEYGNKMSPGDIEKLKNL